jgi:methylase of polypeptide subunit release factors
MEYVPLFHNLRMPRQARALEWCAGPGFIRFALLGYGLCNTLCLADINPEAVEACRLTVTQTGLAERVTV